MKEVTLKNGMKFAKDENTVVRIKKRHGRAFLVSITNKEFGCEIEKLMKKEDILKMPLLEGKVEKIDAIKLSRREMEIMSLVEDGDTVATFTSKMPDLSRSQIAGHISILNRKGFIEIDSETRELTKSAVAEKLIEA